MCNKEKRFFEAFLETLDEYKIPVDKIMSALESLEKQADKAPTHITIIPLDQCSKNIEGIIFQDPESNLCILNGIKNLDFSISLHLLNGEYGPCY